MKNLIVFFMLTILCVFSAKGQHTQIENVRIQLSSNADSMIIHYDIIATAALTEVNLEISNEAGEAIAARSVTGDVGERVEPGMNKTIVWNIVADSLDIYGHQLFVTITGNEWVEILQARQKPWIPWFYIASGASAATGIFAHINAQNIYNNEYLPVSNTDDAGLYNTKVRNWETVRNVALGAAGVFGAVGVVVHVKHNKQKQAITLNYYPQPGGAEFGLTYNF